MDLSVRFVLLRIDCLGFHYLRRKSLSGANLKSIGLLVIAELLTMSLWFLSSAVLPDILKEVELNSFIQAFLSSSVNIGFVIGALGIAVFGLADRFDPRKIFALSAVLAAFFNFSLLFLEIGSGLFVLCRGLTGVCLAGVYPVGMKIAVGWGQKDRGLLVGLMVGALTIGSAFPHLAAFIGEMDWRFAVKLVSLLAFIGGVFVLFCQLGPLDSRATRFQFSDITLCWSNKLIRYPILGYLGHMWELYAMWAWLSAFSVYSFRFHMAETEALSLASLVSFFAIALGGIACVLAGFYADKIGKAQVTIYAMGISAFSALATALSLGGPVWVTIVFILIWGLSIIPDSAQFSALVADHTPAERSGSVLTLQTALGFGLTILTVQGTPLLMGYIGWSITCAVMALGPLFGIYFMRC